MKRWWESYYFSDSPSYVLAQKLKALKLDLRRWNKEELGDVNDRKQQLMSCIQDLDGIEETRTLTEAERLIKDQSKVWTRLVGGKSRELSSFGKVIVRPDFFTQLPTPIVDSVLSVDCWLIGRSLRIRR